MTLPSGEGEVAPAQGLNRLVGRGSRRDALFLVPAAVIPSGLSFVGLIAITRLVNVAAAGLVSLTGIAATSLAALIAEGPGISYLRRRSLDPHAHVSEFRFAVAVGTAPVAVVLAAAGTSLDLAGVGLGRPLQWAAAMVIVEAMLLFNSGAFRADRRFARASALVAVRDLVGWPAAVTAAWLGGSFGYAIGAYLLVSACVLVVFRNLQMRRPDGTTRRELRRVWPHVAATNVAGYALNNGDQFILDGLRGSAAVGVYALGYQLGGGAVGVLSAPITGAIGPRLVREWNDPALGPEVAAATARRTALAIVGLSALVVPVIAAAGLVGLTGLIVKGSDLPVVACIIATASGIHVASSTAYASLLVAGGETQRLSRYSWFTVALSVVAIPGLTMALGVVGAGLAALVGYTFLAALLYFSARRLVRAGRDQE